MPGFLLRFRTYFAAWHLDIGAELQGVGDGSAVLIFPDKSVPAFPSPSIDSKPPCHCLFAHLPILKTFPSQNSGGLCYKSNSPCSWCHNYQIHHFCLFLCHLLIGHRASGCRERCRYHQLGPLQRI